MDSTFTVLGPKGERIHAWSPIAGPFNVANTLAAIVALAVAGLDPQAAADGIAAVPGVPGRLERVDAGQQPTLAVVDYAHKTDAVESVLKALRKVTKGPAARRPRPRRRPRPDQARRAAMGAAAARLADTAVLTSDNPRPEDPLAILATMLQGAASVPAHERGEVLLFEDRAAAIAAAVGRAQAGDTVLVAGKGHRSRARTSPAWSVPSTTARCFAKLSRTPRDENPEDPGDELVIALSLAEIAAVVGGQTHDIPDPSVQVTGPVVRDSREVVPGSLFAAFVGERVDGHDYAAQVVAAGAVAVLASRPVGVPAIVVEDVQTAPRRARPARRTPARRDPRRPDRLGRQDQH